MQIHGEKLAFALERLWGWPTKLARRAFPNFGAVHIVPAAKLPSPQELTLSQWIDPHGNRNWFMNWTGVDANEDKWTIAEWPDAADLGEWALPGSRTLDGRAAQDGKPGPAQLSGGGRTFDEYKHIILQREGWKLNPSGSYEREPEQTWMVLNRYLDPRPANMSLPSDTECKTYLTYLNERLRDYQGRIIGPDLYFEAGVNCGIEEAQQWVNDWICGGWDAQKEPTPLNRPKWFISETCVNTIFALRVWTGFDKEKGATKDPIDCLKGLSKTGLRYISPGMLGTIKKPKGY